LHLQVEFIHLQIMKQTIFLFGICFLFFSCTKKQAKTPEQVLPKYTYLQNLESSTSMTSHLSGAARIIEHEGRMGLNTTSIHSVYEMKDHTLNDMEGSVSFWVLSLEDLSSYLPKNGMNIGNPDFYTYPLLVAHSKPQQDENANFRFFWSPSWHPSLQVFFAKCAGWECYDYPHPGNIHVSHFSFHALKWYQFTLTWNHHIDEYILYLNGLEISRNDQFRTERARRDTVNSSLFMGNPTLVFSEVNYFNQVLTSEETYQHFRQQVKTYDAETEQEIQYTYQGKNRKPFEFELTSDWTKKMDVNLKSRSQMDDLYVQGNPVNVEITPEGLLIETIKKQYNKSLLDSQVYVWSKMNFEGDLYMEYEFKVLRPGGLSLLMVNASGMNREDFMKDYPLKTNGTMVTVYGENVRNYHWEYYREMSDMSNALNNSALMKNPYNVPLAFGTHDQPLEYNRWHKLQYLQVGNRIIGAINGVVMVDALDNGLGNSGAVFDFGHVAIRCMLNTKMLFRDMKVYNRAKVHRVVKVLNP
jgi:hypothetical protein